MLRDSYLRTKISDLCVEADRHRLGTVVIKLGEALAEYDKLVAQEIEDLKKPVKGTVLINRRGSLSGEFLERYKVHAVNDKHVVVRMSTKKLARFSRKHGFAVTDAYKDSQLDAKELAAINAAYEKRSNRL